MLRRNLTRNQIIEEATVITWKGAPQYVQTKLRKTFDAWLDRKVFDMPVLEAIMARIPGQLIAPWSFGCVTVTN